LAALMVATFCGASTLSSSSEAIAEFTTEDAGDEDGEEESVMFLDTSVVSVFG
jgi:hypothetical protein